MSEKNVRRISLWTGHGGLRVDAEGRLLAGYGRIPSERGEVLVVFRADSRDIDRGPTFIEANLSPKNVDALIDLLLAARADSTPGGDNQ